MTVFRAKPRVPQVCALVDVDNLKPAMAHTLGLNNQNKPPSSQQLQDSVPRLLRYAPQTWGTLRGNSYYGIAIAAPETVAATAGLEAGGTGPALPPCPWRSRQVARQKHGNHRPFSLPAVEADTSSMFLDDFETGPKAKAGPRSVLRGKERLKDSAPVRCRDACTVVGDGHAGVPVTVQGERAQAYLQCLLCR